MGSFVNFLSEARQEVRHLRDDASEEEVEQTAQNLERAGYQPPFLMDIPGFTRMRKEDIFHHIGRIANMDNSTFKDMPLAKDRSPEDVKRLIIQMLIQHYSLLVRLRKGEPEAWDEINELYEDD